ncbi:MAG TPA: adenylate kinase family protein [Methanospirillum sp.]|uniref:adenylate kinase family protein n=1 Tax=Methanospirillum sp. TaxID=45200 RepID=UPI002B9490FF|nr:adenylate kinase family protein [Methanospirillum sp.]HOJ96574.1 adenylate kinase family protein [Methanospirillum sp.]
MMIALTGTPGTGKTLVAQELQKRGIPVTYASDTIGPYRLGTDPERDTDIIDEERWAEEFSPVEGIIEGHLTHLLPADRVIILRCRPDVLKERLTRRGYPEKKIKENVEAEILDVCLAEAFDIHGEEKLYEIDTTNADIPDCAEQIEAVIRGTAKPVVGIVDWLITYRDML